MAQLQASSAKHIETMGRDELRLLCESMASNMHPCSEALSIGFHIEDRLPTAGGAAFTVLWLEGGMRSQREALHASFSSDSYDNDLVIY